MKRREFLHIAAAAGIGLSLTALWQKRQVRLERTLMGTTVVLTIEGMAEQAAQDAAQAALNEMARWESVLTRFRPDSALARLNRDGYLQNPPPELLSVLRHAAAVSDASSGAFDVTVAPLLELHDHWWTAFGSPPPAADVESARQLVDWRALSASAARVAFEKPGMRISLDGVAKGAIVDRAVEVLRGRGLSEVLVAGGGDMKGTGRPWRIAVANPLAPDTGMGRIAAEHGISTSGDYERTYSVDRRHHHIIDPRTGWSPAGVSAATVLAPAGVLSDALSTALFVLGPEAGLPLARQFGAEALIVDKTGQQFTTDGWRWIS